MNMKEFSEIIKEKLEEKTGREVRVVEVPKNNGIVLHGVNITEPESNIIPTIYLESFLTDYQAGMEMEEIVEQIKTIWESSRSTERFDSDSLKDFENVKSKLAYKLVNYESNKELLEKVPYERYLDLAKVYYIEIDSRAFGRGTALINNSLLDLWGVTKEQLGQAAEENTPQLFPIEITKMGDIIKEIDGKSLGDFGIDSESGSECLMYVATNTTRLFGASVMCYAGKLKEFAEQQKSDLVILPSSLHEVILLVTRGREDIEYLKEMVNEVNKTHVSTDEILSNSIYIYHRKTDTISVA